MNPVGQKEIANVSFEFSDPVEDRERVSDDSNEDG